MNKNEFLAVLASSGEWNKKEAEQALRALQTALAKSLSETDRLALPGLGVFTVVEKAARKGRNPATGAEIEIPAKKVIRFKPAAELRAVIT